MIKQIPSKEIEQYLKINPKRPRDIERDRFILSKGHGCLAQYVILADKGFFNENELTKFCHLNSILGGHPEYGKIPGVEASTGSLGHGISIGVGMALASRLQNRKNKVIVIVGDGETNEGSVWEAAMSASKHKLSNLIIVIDYNKIQSYSFVSDVLNSEPMFEKWLNFGFAVDEINGHDINSIRNYFLNIPKNINKPSALICHTIKGKGFPFAENNPNWHHKTNLSDADIKMMYDLI